MGGRNPAKPWIYIHKTTIKLMKKLRLLIVLIVGQLSAQQEANFSHYMYNHQAVNPGYVGSRGTTSLTSVLRFQWAGIEGAPETQTLSFNTPVSKKNIAFGLSILNDKIGPISSTSFAADLAYHLRLNRKNHRLAVGLKAGLLNHALNIDMINTLVPNDQAFILESDQKLLPNLGFGFYYYTPNFYAGFALPQVLPHDEYGLERHAYFISGALVNVTETFMLKPSLLLKQTKSIVGYDFSFLGIVNERFWLGGQIRNNFNSETFKSFSGSGLSALMGIQLGKNITLGYAYGLPGGIDRNGLNFATHEVLLRYDFSTAIEGLLRSPRFF